MLGNPAALWINHDQRAGAKQREHGPIRQAHVTVGVTTRIAIEQEGSRYLSPKGYNSIHQLGGLPTKRGIDAHWNKYLLFKSVDLRGSHARNFGKQASSVGSGAICVYAVLAENVMEIKSIDGAKSE